MKTQMSPARATLLHSPGHKPWGIIVNILIEPLQGRHYSRQKQMLAPKVPLLRSSYFLCPCLPRVPFRALPSLHPGLCRSVVPTALVISLNVDTVTLDAQLVCICHVHFDLLNRDHCIIRHWLHYFRHSAPVIYKSPPVPSVSMPCESRILKSPTQGQVLLVLGETVGRSQITLLIGEIMRRIS